MLSLGDGASSTVSMAECDDNPVGPGRGESGASLDENLTPQTKHSSSMMVRTSIC